MPERQILVGAKEGRPARHPADPHQAWRWIGWLGLVLVLEGLADFVLAWFPLHLGTPEWEFATVAATFSGLPLITMGLAGLLGSGLALGTRWLIRVMAWFMMIWAVVIAAGFVVFLLDVPIALRAVEAGPAALGIKRAVAKTALLAVGFGGAYVAGAVAALRHLRRST